MSAYVYAIMVTIIRALTYSSNPSFQNSGSATGDDVCDTSQGWLRDHIAEFELAVCSKYAGTYVLRIWSLSACAYNSRW